MALLKKPISQILGAYTQWSPTAQGQQVIQWSLDARRLMILGPRLAGGALLGHHGPNTRKQPQFEKAQESIRVKQESILSDPDTRDQPDFTSAQIDIQIAQERVLVEKNVTPHSFKTTIGAVAVEDYVAIMDIDALGYDEGYRVIKLPFIPTELNYSVDSAFAAIKPIGRNNAKYHYTGSEDKLEFEIDWHSSNSLRDDVIRNCRIIEALSKGDGYNNPPHRVMIHWGINNVLFRDHVFLVTSASYRLTHFNKAQINQQNGEVERTNMLPIQAYQRVTLARVTSANLLTTEIEYVAPNTGTSNS